MDLKEGEIITIINKDLPDKGWWKGEIRGKIGVFPDNFVQIVPGDGNIKLTVSTILIKTGIDTIFFLSNFQDLRLKIPHSQLQNGLHPQQNFKSTTIPTIRIAITLQPNCPTVLAPEIH